MNTLKLKSDSSALDSCKFESDLIKHSKKDLVLLYLILFECIL